MRRFEGKSVFVTGAGSGIGAAVARAFAKEGAMLALVDRDEAGLAATCREIEAGGTSVLSACVDVSQSGEIAAFVAKICETFGRLDCAVNAAGVSGAPKPLAEIGEEEFDRIQSINLRGVWLCMKHEILAMLPTGGGAIVNIASGAGLLTVPNMGHYVTSKHGVVGLTKAGAADYAAQNIRINCVCPGYTRTPMALGSIEDMSGVTTDDIAAALPIKRIAEPEEQAAAVLFLCSPESSYMVGHALVADGGHSII